RTVDVEASVAEAMQLMVRYASIAGEMQDVPRWQKMAEDRIQRTRSMFVQGWFRDVDGRSGQPILFDDFYDAAMLAPLTVNIAADSQINDIKPGLNHFAENPRYLQWPPGLMAFTEAAYYADEPLLAGRAVAQTADRVYARTDSSQIMFADSDEPFAYRIPGVANEFWPVALRPAGAENYGWGATLPAYIIRHIAGFRETENGAANAFYLTPAIPPDLNKIGSRLVISHLKFRDICFQIEYRIGDEENLDISLKIMKPEGKHFQVLNKDGRILPLKADGKKQTGLTFSGQNGQGYLIRFE
ncbi:MAG: hypothetical protein WAN36_05010, partial [Calditrichia bacterium]